MIQRGRSTGPSSKVTGVFRVLSTIGAALGGWLASALLAAPAYAEAAGPPVITPSSMPRIGTVDERFQSYNIEMIEVTGGRFWKPYGSRTSDRHSDLYEYRTPIDLTNPRCDR